MNYKNLAIGVLVVFVFILGYSNLQGALFRAASGPSHYQKESFLQGLAAGVRDQLSISNTGNLTTSGTITIGSSGTAQSNQVVTSCSLIANNSILATTSGYAYCTGVTGVTSSDYVMASFSTTTQALAITDNWIIFNAKASSTAGAIDFWLYNATGGNRTPSASSRIGSTTVIRAGH